jgi:Globin
VNLDLEALETSFDLVAPRGDELMDVFYAKLFAAAPAVKPLFARTDLKKQKAMLLGTLVLLRKSLRDLDAIVPKLRELGTRHVAYGARRALSRRGRGPDRLDGGDRRLGVDGRVRAGVGERVRDRGRRDDRGGGVGADRGGGLRQAAAGQWVTLTSSKASWWPLTTFSEISPIPAA